jgi:hypothetical protein
MSSKNFKTRAGFEHQDKKFVRTSNHAIRSRKVKVKILSGTSESSCVCCPDLYIHFRHALLCFFYLCCMKRLCSVLNSVSWSTRLFSHATQSRLYRIRRSSHSIFLLNNLTNNSIHSCMHCQFVREGCMKS